MLQLGFRGMSGVRSDVPLWDFVSVHSASRTWIHGGDPYDLASVTTTWRQSGIFTDRDVSYFATVYPPTSLLVLAPLAVLPAPAAMVAWLLLTTPLLVEYVALGHGPDSGRDPRALLLAGAAPASRRFNLAFCQANCPCRRFPCRSCALQAGRGRKMLAGVLLGLACAMKPQVAGPFVVYYLLMRRFKLSGDRHRDHRRRRRGGIAADAFFAAKLVGRMDAKRRGHATKAWLPTWFKVVPARGPCADQAPSAPWRNTCRSPSLLPTTRSGRPSLFRSRTAGAACVALLGSVAITLPSVKSRAAALRPL